MTDTIDAVALSEARAALSAFRDARASDSNDRELLAAYRVAEVLAELIGLPDWDDAEPEARQPLTLDQAHELFDAHLNSQGRAAAVDGMAYWPAEILRAVDPDMYDIKFDHWAAGKGVVPVAGQRGGHVIRDALTGAALPADPGKLPLDLRGRRSQSKPT